MAETIREEQRDERGKRVAARVIRCEVCDHPVELWSGWANACENCPAEYEGGGYRLAPRRFWGEETGEQPWSDLNLNEED